MEPTLELLEEITLPPCTDVVVVVCVVSIDVVVVVLVVNVTAPFPAGVTVSEDEVYVCTFVFVTTVVGGENSEENIGEQRRRRIHSL